MKASKLNVKNCHQIRQNSGFTLIEVLVALTIVAITLGAGIKAAGALTDNTQRLADMTSAQWCADNQLTGLRLSGIAPPTGDSDFTCMQLGITYRGKLVVRPTPNPLFVNVDAQISNEAGQPILNLLTVLRK
jgi:general secretion pathway protein I